MFSINVVVAFIIPSWQFFSCPALVNDHNLSFLPGLFNLLERRWDVYVPALVCCSQQHMLNCLIRLTLGWRVFCCDFCSILWSHKFSLTTKRFYSFLSIWPFSQQCISISFSPSSDLSCTFSSTASSASWRSCFKHSLSRRKCFTRLCQRRTLASISQQQASVKSSFGGDTIRILMLFMVWWSQKVYGDIPWGAEVIGSL